MVIKLAAVQMRSGASPEKNAGDMSPLVRDAAGRGAIFVETPEMAGMLQRDCKKVYNLKTARDFVLEDVPGHGAGGVTA